MPIFTKIIFNHPTDKVNCWMVDWLVNQLGKLGAGAWHNSLIQLHLYPHNPGAEFALVKPCRSGGLAGWIDSGSSRGPINRPSWGSYDLLLFFFTLRSPVRSPIWDYVSATVVRFVVRFWTTVVRKLLRCLKPICSPICSPFLDYMLHSGSLGSQNQ